MNKILLFIYLMNSMINAYDRNSIVCISLGIDCEGTQQLRNHNLRFEAFPFDWNQTFDIDGLLRILENDFSNFLYKDYLVPQGVFVKNTYYNINFIHDFPNSVTRQASDDAEISDLGEILANFSDALPIVKQKYDRRIKRFQEVLLSGKEILFFRTHTTPEEARNFVQRVSAKFANKLNFTLIILHNYADLRSNWNIQRVKSFYMTEYLFPVFNPNLENLKVWWSDKEWLQVFQALGLA